MSRSCSSYPPCASVGVLWDCFFIFLYFLILQHWYNLLLFSATSSLRIRHLFKNVDKIIRGFLVCSISLNAVIRMYRTECKALWRHVCIDELSLAVLLSPISYQCEEGSRKIIALQSGAHISAVFIQKGNMIRQLCGVYSRQTMRWSLRGVNILSAVRGVYRACRWIEDFLLVNAKVT
jgi:hypothetical protein